MRIALLWLLMLPGGLGAADNLLTNGTFEAGRGLDGWMTDYRWSGNRHYTQNHGRVTQATGEGRSGDAMKIVLTDSLAENQGAWVDSHPVEVDPKADYRLSAWARTTGPNCRIFIEGYRWKRGVEPHSNPKLGELRKVYRQGAGKILYFDDVRSGVFSRPRRKWARGECTFPPKGLSALGRRHLKQVQFIVVHIAVVGGRGGALLLDDIVLEKVER